MLQNTFKALAAALTITAAATAYAETKALVKTNNFFETEPATPPSTSPWFNLDVAGGALSPSIDANAMNQTQGHTVS